MFIFLTMFFLLLCNPVYAEYPTAFEWIKGDKIIFVDKSEVIMDDVTGTSRELNTLISNYSNSTGTLRSQIHREYHPNYFDGNIFVYDINNVKYLKVRADCDYLNALDCGVRNNHWTLKTHVTVGEKFSTLNLQLYDERGIVIARSSKTIKGMIRVKPQWKLTTINQKTPMGASKTQILEQYPPTIEELPPLITPYHINQAMIGLYLSLDLKKNTQ